MKEFTIEEIIDYADKLLIGLSKEEATSIKEEFSCIDKNIDKINNIPNLQSITPSAFPFNSPPLELLLLYLQRLCHLLKEALRER